MNIIITGANGKLGQNIVDRLKKNNNIIVISRNVEKSNIIFKNQKNSFIYYCDLENYEEIDIVMNKITNDFEKIEILINNAALDINQPMLETSKDELEKIFKINTYAPYYLVQKLLPNMIENKFGKIINISSDLSVRTVKNAAEYSMTKAALDSLTRSIAVEYGEYGILANTMSINGMKGYLTKVNENLDVFSKEDKDYDDWKQPKERIPLQRRGNFSEFIDVIEFLCSNKSNYITGINIPVDGGIIAKL